MEIHWQLMSPLVGYYQRKSWVHMNFCDSNLKCLDQEELGLKPFERWQLTFNQWPFQDPKREVPTICKAYVRPKFQGVSPQNMAKYGTNIPPF
jgi:hypothetical protein